MLAFGIAYGGIGQTFPGSKLFGGYEAGTHEHSFRTVEAYFQFSGMVALRKGCVKVVISASQVHVSEDGLRVLQLGFCSQYDVKGLRDFYRSRAFNGLLDG